MDEPHEVTAGLDDSLASEVGDRVRKIVDDAERDAIAARMNADDEARAAIASARAEAEGLRDEALREAQLAAADRVRQLRELQRLIEERAAELAELTDEPGAVMAQVDALLGALDDRAAMVALEAGEARPEETPEPERAEEPEPEPEPAPAETASNGAGGPTVAPLAMPHPVLPGSETELLEEARLGALRMAVAGASREELEPVLRQIFRPDDAVAVLDDVYGRPRSPFPKWAAATKRAG